MPNDPEWEDTKDLDQVYWEELDGFDPADSYDIEYDVP